MYQEAIETIDWAKAPHILISGVPEFQRDAIVGCVIAHLERAVGDTTAYVVTAENAEVTLSELATIMAARNEELTISFAKSIDHYNRMADSDSQLAHLVCFIQEMAVFRRDDDALASIMKLAAHGRAVGIHVVVLTSDIAPSSITIPGRIRTNLLQHIELGVNKPVTERVKTEVMFLSVMIDNPKDVEASEQTLAQAIDDGFTVTAMSNGASNGLTTVMLVRPGGWRTTEATTQHQ